jgi:SAM-dependent methyltransferase
MGEALARWERDLAAWALPERITAAVTESPWATPVDVFARRADRAIAAPEGASWQRAAEALGPSGSIVDVGAGAGAASLAHAAHLTELTAVDTDESILDALVARAAALSLPVRTIVGRWPQVAPETPVADVVVCHHVFYNVAALDAFATALTGHARRRVVVELTAAHPVRVLNPLWKRLHDLDRPTGPTADDAVAVLREAGIDPHEQRWRRGPRPPHPSFEHLVATTRRRLCLPAERDAELADALTELGVDPAQPRDLSADEVVTLWWDA